MENPGPAPRLIVWSYFGMFQHLHKTGSGRLPWRAQKNTRGGAPRVYWAECSLSAEHSTLSTESAGSCTSFLTRLHARRGGQHTRGERPRRMIGCEASV